jgi:UDP-N-acetylmuramate-alanine ligase
MSHRVMTYYFIGIGGVGMSALARLCVLQGHKVLDMTECIQPLQTNWKRRGLP